MRLVVKFLALIVLSIGTVGAVALYSQWQLNSLSKDLAAASYDVDQAQTLTRRIDQILHDAHLYAQEKDAAKLKTLSTQIDTESQQAKQIASNLQTTGRYPGLTAMADTPIASAKAIVTINNQQ